MFLNVDKNKTVRMEEIVGFFSGADNRKKSETTVVFASGEKYKTKSTIHSLRKRIERGWKEGRSK